MEQIDFDELVNRRGTDSVKWDVAPGELPMWVADMDFRAAEPIRRALTERAANGVYGYPILTDAWYDAYIEWWKNRHGVTIERDWLAFSTGVIPAVACAVQALSSEGAGVVVQPPVYHIFFKAITAVGRRVVESPLVLDEETLQYSIDFEDLAAKLRDARTELLLLCNPQNPGGRIWSAEELGRIGSLCAENGVKVISDEIHCDITEPGKKYVPWVSLGSELADLSVTCVSPTKAFNLAGVRSAAVFIPNDEMREKVTGALHLSLASEPNVFAPPATVAAFTQSVEWLDAMCRYVWGNMEYVYSFLAEKLPALRAVHGDATYLMWIDCGAVTDDSEAFASELRKQTGLYVSHGAMFRGDGHRFIRLNVACPRSLVEDAMQRLKTFVDSLPDRA